MSLLTLKKIINKTLESSSKIKNLYNKYSQINKPVLLIGDGISSVYIDEFLNKYEFIIAVNKSILNQKLKGNQLLYWIFMPPNFWYEHLRNDPDLWEAVRENLNSYKNITNIMHPLGRLLNFGKWKNNYPLYLSPYHTYKLQSGCSYNNFTGALQASLGVALLSGFKEIHCAGFDSWLLAPKNNLRWYTKCANPDDFDYNSSTSVPKFLEISARNSNIYVYSYRHYKPKYEFISEINTYRKDIYIPKNDRLKFMRPSDLKIWNDYENLRYPNGYELKKED